MGRNQKASRVSPEGLMRLSPFCVRDYSAAAFFAAAPNRAFSSPDT